MRVEEVMTSSVRTCRSTDTLHAVVQLLWDHDLGSLPVVDGLGRPLAMITDRDIAMAAYTQGKPLHQLLVDWAMSKTVVTTHVNDKLSAAERTMRVHQIRRLPVVDDTSKLVGILSLNDIARARLLAARPTEQRALLTTVAAIACKRTRPSLEEYASQQMVTFEQPTAPKRSRTVTVVKKRARTRPALPTESGVFVSAAVDLREAALEAV